MTDSLSNKCLTIKGFRYKKETSLWRGFSYVFGMETISEKECFKCHVVKSLVEFYHHPQMADGHLNKCKLCTKTDVNRHRNDNLERVQKADRDRYTADPEKKKQNAKRYRKENLEKCNAYHEKWIKENPEKWKVIYQRWRDNNPGYTTRYDKERVAIDPSYASMKRLRVRLRNAVAAAGGKKAGSTIALIGCSPLDLVGHIETLFTDGMSWDNRHLWHIDHIRPCSSFDLTDADQQKLCFHYTNLQPLWEGDNLCKGDKFPLI